LCFVWLVALFPPPDTARLIFGGADNPAARTAARWSSACNGVQCFVCPFKCFLPEGMRGRCRVRLNSGGELKTLVYGGAVSAHIDPIEKKPVFHMLPGSWIYSIATAGCNLRCKACQNWEISQIYPEQAEKSILVPTGLDIVPVPGSPGMASVQLKTEPKSWLPPEDVVNYALAARSKSIAYTYSEPIVFYEYVRDTAALARKRGLKNVLVTGGYANPAAFKALIKDFDVVKIDLKGFDEKFYSGYVGGELENVKRAMLAAKETGIQLEIVNLVIPGLNDSEASITALCRWVKDNLGADTPLFFSRFGPNYKLANLPPTPVETLERARNSAIKAGLRFVYVGNLPGGAGETTFCPKCGKPLIVRYGYRVLQDVVTPSGGKCPYDGTPIPGIWK